MDHGWLDRCRPTVPWLWGLSEGCFFCVHVLSSSAHHLCCGGMYVHAVLVLCWYKQRTLSLLTFRRSQNQAQHMFVQLLFHVKALICTRSCFFVVDFELSIYIEQITKENVATIEEQFLSGDKYDEEELRASEPALAAPETDVAYFRELLSGVVLSHAELDSKIRPYVSRPMQDLDMMELALLRLAMYEMTRREDVPYKVVINEAIELAKVFAAEDSHKFVNGVLDKAAPHVRKK